MNEHKETVYEAAEALLATVNQIYMDAGESLPTRQYISGGRNTDAPHDCEQVVVSFEQLYNGPPGAQVQEPTGCNSIRSIVFSVEVVRCQPLAKQASRSSQAGPPDPEDLNAAAMVQAIDMWLLVDAGLTFAEGDRGIGGLADANIGPESGGMQGVILNLVTAEL